jgi:hypothetical protein
MTAETIAGTKPRVARKVPVKTKTATVAAEVAAEVVGTVEAPVAVNTVTARGNDLSIPAGWLAEYDYQIQELYRQNPRWCNTDAAYNYPREYEVNGKQIQAPRARRELEAMARDRTRAGGKAEQTIETVPDEWLSEQGLAIRVANRKAEITELRRLAYIAGEMAVRTHKASLEQVNVCLTAMQMSPIVNQAAFRHYTNTMFYFETGAGISAEAIQATRDKIVAATKAILLEDYPGAALSAEPNARRDTGGRHAYVPDNEEEAAAVNATVNRGMY